MNTAIENQQTPWYAVQTRPKWEKLSAGMLADKGYQVFYPARPAKGNMDQPLFPSYLFCRSTTDSFGRIVSTPGVIRLLGRPGHPECVPDAEITGVRQLLEAGMPMDEGIGLARGQRVRIRCGSLAGLVGEVLGEAGNQRLAVSICLLQRFVSVALDPSWLELETGREQVS